MNKGPYVGARALAWGEKLYGRDWEVRELHDLLIGKRIVLMHAASGAGKTSLIQAGLLPLLEKEGNLVLPPLLKVGSLPGKDLPLEQVSNRYVLSTLLALDDWLPEAQRTMPSVLAGMKLRDYLEQRAKALATRGARTNPEAVLLVFDQFEELLTAHQTDQEVKKDFMKQITDVLRDYGYWALFAIRQDYLGALDPYTALFPNRLNIRFHLDLLNPSQALEAIVQPASDHQVTFDQRAADRLVNELREVNVQQPDGSMEVQQGPVVEPVQLQVVCTQLWESTRADASRITEEDLQTLGGVDQALAGYYEHCVAQVAAKIGESERRIRNWFDQQLITAQGLRGQVMFEGPKSKGLSDKAIRALIDLYLVREEQRRGTLWYELAHDRLIQPVRKNNQDWRERNLTRLQRQAVAWAEQGRLPTLLLRGAELAKEERRIQKQLRELDEIEEEFLNKSRAAAQERAQRSGLGTNLAETGWGVIFADDIEPAVREALSPLLDLRRSEATEEREDYYGEFSFRTDPLARGVLESSLDWFDFKSRLQGPAKLPYYLLIVGAPTKIPFEFQYYLDMQYAVGRIYFDTLEEYANYARSVVQTETVGTALPRRVVLYAPRYTGDQLISLAHDQLIKPLADEMLRIAGPQAFEGVFGEEATREHLIRLLGGLDTPALLFTLTRGMEFKLEDRRQIEVELDAKPTFYEDPRQRSSQGALICQDWPGPDEWRDTKQFAPNWYVAAADLVTNARLQGLIGVFIGEFTAGTTRYDDFARSASENAPLARWPFLAALPQRLLAHPSGGALAIVGNIGKGWSYSWQSTGSGQDRGLLAEADRAANEEYELLLGLLAGLLQGQTVGRAMEVFNRRYAQLSTREASILREIVYRGDRRGSELNDLTKAAIAVRNYIVIGDPAVRLAANLTPRLGTSTSARAGEPIS